MILNLENKIIVNTLKNVVYSLPFLQYVTKNSYVYNKKIKIKLLLFQSL